MIRVGKLLAGSAVFGFGYLCGVFHAGDTSGLNAVQEQKAVESISNDTLMAYAKFRKSSNDLADSLSGESLNVSATEGVNFFAAVGCRNRCGARSGRGSGS